jgi:hypothetical protein
MVLELKWMMKKAPAVIAGASKSKDDVLLRREIMVTTQETRSGFRFSNDLDVLESDHVQHLTFGPRWAMQMVQCTHDRCFAQPISHMD